LRQYSFLILYKGVVGYKAGTVFLFQNPDIILQGFLAGRVGAVVDAPDMVVFFSVIEIRNSVTV
jgi:hypothetical protein